MSNSTFKWRRFVNFQENSWVLIVPIRNSRCNTQCRTDKDNPTRQIKCAIIEVTESSFSPCCEIQTCSFYFVSLQKTIVSRVHLRDHNKLNERKTIATYLISSSFAKTITTLAFGFSPSLWIILSNSPTLGSRGIFTDCEIHTLPAKEKKCCCVTGSLKTNYMLTMFTSHVKPNKNSEMMFVSNEDQTIQDQYWKTVMLRFQT